MDTFEKEIEFYKIIKGEYNQFLIYIESLWRLKLLAVGAIISFAILNEKILELITSNVNESIGVDLAAIGVLIIPVLAFVIDLKILETALHLKNISSYLELNLETLDIAKRWELKNWETGIFKTNRSFFAFLSTIGISFIILFLSVLIVSLYLKPEWAITCITIGIITFVIGNISIIFFARNLFKRKDTAPNKVQNVHSRQAPNSQT